MARSALTAPAHVVQQRNALGNANQQADSAPSLQYGGGPGIQDSRLPYNLANSGTGAQIVGWYNNLVCNAVPSALAANNIAASQSGATGTPLNLVSVTGAGVTVLSSPQIMLPSLVSVPAGTLALDGPVGYQRFGQRDVTVFYDHTTTLSRAVRIVSAGNDSGITFLISGFDIYGFPMTQRLTGANIGTATTTKTFKYISSIVPSGNTAAAVTVGTTDVYGFGLRADQWGYVYLVWAGTTVTASTGFTAADTTNPATNLTGDVRGKYATQSASNGTNRLEMEVLPNIVALNVTPITNGLFGVPQA